MPQIPLDPQFEQLRLGAEQDKTNAIAARMRGETALNIARYGTPDSAAVLQRYGTQLALAGSLGGTLSRTAG